MGQNINTSGYTPVPVIKEQLEVLRRIADKGKEMSEKDGNHKYIDIFDHLRTEVAYLKGYLLVDLNEKGYACN